ncbi:hypothetical protein RN001_003233 [Aquatica leii]|uniref:THAP-type domain-containing protein n=1 Tax=Aquatica leii TaxID=1421715 RepID=A0AAN7PI05_9COLE|nr:hypothetical protein RN001_003233 [Aquatica leii]
MYLTSCVFKMPKCYYNNCSSTSKSKQFKNLRYHPFPKPTRNMARCLLWIDLCANDQLNTFNITKNVYVCEKHFLDNNTDPTPYSTCTLDGIRDPASLAIQSTVEIGTAEVANDVNTVDSGHKAATDHLYNKPYRMVTLPLLMLEAQKQD